MASTPSARARAVVRRQPAEPLRPPAKLVCGALARAAVAAEQHEAACAMHLERARRLHAGLKLEVLPHGGTVRTQQAHTAGLAARRGFRQLLHLGAVRVDVVETEQRR